MDKWVVRVCSHCRVIDPVRRRKARRGGGPGHCQRKHGSMQVVTTGARQILRDAMSARANKWSAGWAVRRMMRMTRASRLSSGVLMVVISVLAMQAGQAVAKQTFSLASPVVVTALRFGLGALVLWTVFRPRWPTDSRTQWAVIALGTALAGTNLFIYESAARMPLGLAITMQFVGALAVSLATSRRLHQVVWVLVAAVAVGFLYSGPLGAASGTGVAYAAASAVCWGGYIVLTSYVGSRTPGGQGMALATAWAAVLTVPLGLLADSRAFVNPAVLVAGLGVALLCSVVANSLELRALRRISSRVFGVLVSLEPAVAALAGLVLLGEHLSLLQWCAISAIVAASIGITTETRCGTARQLSLLARLSKRSRYSNDHHAANWKRCSTRGE